MRAAAAHRGCKKLCVNLKHFNKLFGDKMFSSSPAFDIIVTYIRGKNVCVLNLVIVISISPLLLKPVKDVAASVSRSPVTSTLQSHKSNPNP